MLLAIVPLSVVSYLAIRRVQGDARRAAVASVEQAVAWRVAQFESWLKLYRQGLAMAVGSAEFRRAVDDESWDDACRALSNPLLIDDVEAVALVSADAQTTLCASGPLQRSGIAQAFPIIALVNSSSGLQVATLVAYPDPQALDELVQPFGLETGQRLLLINARADLVFATGEASEQWPEGPLHTWAATQALTEDRGSGLYDDPLGVPVVGAWRWLVDPRVALLVEQPQKSALAGADELATMLIASTLAVALLTTLLAAVIIRQLVRPIVQLTMSAVKIANGDLGQKVLVNRRDEIGILGQAFNIMTAELRSLYDGLEQKVAERTRLLSEANQQLRYQAGQLALSAEVGRIGTSTLDLVPLLERVTQAVVDGYSDIYEMRYAGVLLLDRFEQWVELQASAGAGRMGTLSHTSVRADNVIAQVIADGLLRKTDLNDPAIEIAVPLRIGPRPIGVLDMQCQPQQALTQHDCDVWQGLGDQISVAIENARIYAAQREAVERLSRLDHMRLASLGIGSRELATELNTIIGFSRLILKGVDGPLTDTQRTDLIAIHRSGYSLLGLIDNVIALSELESGEIDAKHESVDLSSLLSEAIASARQRLVGVAVEWDKEESGILVGGDKKLLLQAFLSLITATAERVPQNRVTVSSRTSGSGNGRAIVQFGNTNQVWQRAAGFDLSAGDPAASEGNPSLSDTSVGLKLAKQIVELHRGTLHLAFDAERGLSGMVVLGLVKPEGS